MLHDYNMKMRFLCEQYYTQPQGCERYYFTFLFHLLIAKAIMTILFYAVLRAKEKRRKNEKKNSEFNLISSINHVLVRWIPLTWTSGLFRDIHLCTNICYVPCCSYHWFVAMSFDIFLHKRNTKDIILAAFTSMPTFNWTFWIFF